MSQRIIECVPNFSEGRDSAKINQIAESIKSVPGIDLLSVEPGADTHRTVMTFVGEPEAVGEAAFRAIACAAQLIDMSQHKGEHPRMGATDVCPFVPVQGTTMMECAELARKVGKRVGEQLGIPVYLYEQAASSPERTNLAEVRRGEYEGLENKLRDPQWKPDFGPAKLNVRSGATAIGAREFLIAYNITLNSNDKQHATDIAFELREKGRVARTGRIQPYYFKGKKLSYAPGVFPCGSCSFVGESYAEVSNHCEKTHAYDLTALLKSNDLDVGQLIGKNVFRPGKFKECKAIGWYVDEFKRAQISINLTNYKITPPHLVLEEARRLAAERGLVVTGSEIVGLIPYQALLESGKFYLEKQGRTLGMPVSDVLRTAVFSMGLADVTPFELSKKVIGLPVDPDKALVKLSVRALTDEVSRDTPAPGGGSIAALAGALGAALASMVATLTHGKEGSEAKDPELNRIAERAQTVKDQLLLGVDDDTNAFNSFLEARRLPQNTQEEKQLRLEKMQQGMKSAIDVPWRTAQASFEAMLLSKEVAGWGNPNSMTDAAVGLQMAYSGLRGALWNVSINLKDVNDPQYVSEMQNRVDDLLKKARTTLEEGGAFVDARLREMINKPKKC